MARALGGWNEVYPVASGEDVDLAFTVWVNDLDIVFDQRVLVDHVGKASARHLGDWRSLWDQNREIFLARWKNPDDEVPMLASCTPERFERNKATASATAEWMDRYFSARSRSRWSLLDGRRLIDRFVAAVRRSWDLVERTGPTPLAQGSGRLRRTLQERAARRRRAERSRTTAPSGPLASPRDPSVPDQDARRRG